MIYLSVTASASRRATRRTRSTMSALVAVCVAASVAVSGVALTGPAVAAEPNPVEAAGDFTASAYGTELRIVGKGFGHGRGLSQYGSYGYAVDRSLEWQKILETYYPNTTAGAVDVARSISTRLVEMDDQSTVIVHDGGRLTIGTFAPNVPIPGEFAAVMVRKNPTFPGQFDVYSGTGCDTPTSTWTFLATVMNVTDQGAVTFDAVGRSDVETDLTKLLAVCEPDFQKRYYRGWFRLWAGSNNGERLANITGVEQYLRGVVPRESPAAWGNAGEGKGMNALRAQAVAARSYALSEARVTMPYAQTCDTQSCQVYSGAAVFNPGAATLTPLEHPNTDTAIADTAGQIRLLDASVARAEFSSSTGGWTAGGNSFPVVEDLGDATSINPNYNWQTSVSRSIIEERYPQLGTLLLVNVTKRNGIGQWGGRVRSVELRGTAGNVSLTGDVMRIALGLKSDWFYVPPPFTDTPVTGVATAPNGGYWMTTTEGGVYTFGLASWSGSMAGQALNSPVIGMATAGPKSYWLLGRDGGIFAFGGAPFYGSTGNIRLNKPVVGMAGRPQSDGYWFVASDGGIFAYGGAPFVGSMGGTRLNKPVVGMAATATGSGYWLVASDGGVFAFGDAGFYGSTGSLALVKPIVGMAARPQGDGYWFVASDGGVFAFGGALFHGSAAGVATSPVVAISTTPTGKGYRIVTSDGTVYDYGDAAPSP